MSEKENKNIVVKVPVRPESDAAETLSWVVRNFLCSVCSRYLRGAPRREEAHRMAVDMVVNANDTLQITNVQAAAICEELKKIEEQIYPGCSLL